MSESILKALMQLFAIIAGNDLDTAQLRKVVQAFLLKQLNEELAIEYLNEFDKNVQMYQPDLGVPEHNHRKIASSSVRVIKICTQINEELTQQQKIIVLVHLLEFLSSANEKVEGQKMEFIDTVAETFHIDDTEYIQLKEFVLFDFANLPHNNRILTIDSLKEPESSSDIHITKDLLSGKICFFYMPSGGIYLFKYKGDAELMLNGQLIQSDKVYTMYPGSSLRGSAIKTIYYSDIVSRFHSEEINSKLIFEAHNISFKFKNNKTGIQPMSFTEESGKLIGIMGSSGSGKTTLLNLLSGIYTPQKGEVLINGVNIHRESNKIKGFIGYVSQDSLLIEELSVYDNLFSCARLCFGNLSHKAIAERVDKMLKTLGLYEIKDVQVGNPLNKKVSGGQRKRLNIALELIREPSVLFLDEPTSGLSSRDSENIMDLLQELALKGKLIFTVIHQPSSDIFKMFNRLLILDTGGYLIYDGDPIESIVYFKSQIKHANWTESECSHCGNVNPELLLHIIDTNVLNEYGRPTGTRKFSPQEWNRMYLQKQQSLSSSELPAVNKLPQSTFKVPHRLRQLATFLWRDVKAKLSNTQYLFINLIEAPLLAFILAFLTKYVQPNNLTREYLFEENINLPVYLFMSVIVAIFMGLTLSAEEIIKDRKILRRESFLNLSWSAYLVSKIIIMAFISAIQAFLFVWVGNSVFEIRGMYLEYWLVLFSCWTSANLIGLVISDSFKTVVTIYILIPFLVIPQIILSGVLVKFEHLNPHISSPDRIPVYGELILSRWGFEALLVNQFMNNPYQSLIYPYDKAMSKAEFRKNYWLPHLRNKLDEIVRSEAQNQNTPTKNIRKLIITELQKEATGNLKVKPGFDVKNEKFDVIQVRDYLDRLNQFYINQYNRASALKDRLILSYQRTAVEKDAFLLLKRTYNNERLQEFATNSNEINRIVEYKNNLYQKIDPIYRDPEGKLIKAHFYAPVKRIGDQTIPTFWMNIFVIWAYSILMYIVLYFRVLRNFLNLFDTLIDKIKAGE